MLLLLLTQSLLMTLVHILLLTLMLIKQLIQIPLCGSGGSGDTVTEASADDIAPAGSDGSNSIDTDTIPGSVGADPYHVQQFIGVIHGSQRFLAKVCKC